MAAEKRSGHFRLKQALILRDALADELGLDLPKAMAQLYNVEDNAGASRALDEGRYLEALSALCLHDKDPLTRLNGLVSAACGRAKLAPRYAQYLALLLFAHWHEAQQDDREAFLARLNAWLAAHPPTQDSVRAEVSKHERNTGLEPFTEDDLQMAAFWMATAAGKTHVLHAGLALLEGVCTGDDKKEEADGFKFIEKFQ